MKYVILAKARATESLAWNGKEWLKERQQDGREVFQDSIAGQELRAALIDWPESGARIVEVL